MNIKSNSALGRALTGSQKQSDSEQLEKLQNTLVASIAKKRRSLAALSGDEATAMLANIANLERMLDGAIEMSNALDPATDEQRDDEQRSDDTSSALDLKAFNERRNAKRYGHAAQ